MVTNVARMWLSRSTHDVDFTVDDTHNYDTWSWEFQLVCIAIDASIGMGMGMGTGTGKFMDLCMGGGMCNFAARGRAIAVGFGMAMGMVTCMSIGMVMAKVIGMHGHSDHCFDEVGDDNDGNGGLLRRRICVSMPQQSE